MPKIMILKVKIEQVFIKIIRSIAEIMYGFTEGYELFAV